MTDPQAVLPILTGEQQAALGTSQASVALSAGAGCGKTYVLTERFIRHLAGEGLPACALARLVTLTFTDKAARELRERVRASCRSRGAQGTVEARRGWRSILRRIEAAPIGTFHAVSGEILRRFSIEAGVEPGFAIAEESITPSIQEEAISRCVRTWLAEGDEDFHALAVELGVPQVCDCLSRLVSLRTRGNLAWWGYREPEEIVDRWRSVWETRVLPATVEHFVSFAQPLVDVLDPADCSHPVMRDRISFLKESLSLLREQANPQALLKEIQDHAKVQGGGGKSKWVSEETYQSAKSVLERIRDATKKITSCVYDEVITRQGAEMAGRLARLASTATDTYEQAKRELSLLDFDDLLVRLRLILENPPETVREWLASSIDFVMVDEFQDTDPIQGEIVRRLAGADLESGRLFLVGDVKQSIYRFRGASPQVFDQFRSSFPMEGRLRLTANFRSRPEVLDFVNAVFADAFRDGPHLLAPGHESPERDGRVAVEFLWAHTNTNDIDGDSTQSVDQRRRLEARWIAGHLARRLAEGWPILDKIKKKSRDANAGDVVLLFRSLNDAAVYESAIVRAGLDYHVVGGAAFYGQQEVLDVINLLSVIEDPFDELALAATLRSPFGCISDVGLYWLSTTAHGALALGLKNCESVTELADLDRQRARRFETLSTRWRSLKDRVSIASLLEQCLDESGYEAALVGEFLGERRRANVRKLVRLARRYDSQAGLTLADFVARLRADYNDPPREDEAATTDEMGQAVRLMTIHQAKGLEFPIVVLPDLNRQAPTSRSAMSFHPDLGPILKPPEDDSTTELKGQGESLGRLALKEFERQEDAEEALCLFYVATTRARDALILSAGMSPGEAPRSPALRLLDERFDPVTGQCRIHSEHWTAPTVRVHLTEPTNPAAARSVAGRRVPRVRQIRRIIERSSLSEPPLQLVANSRQLQVDLDPARTLSSHASRVLRLMRAILNDPNCWNARALPEISSRHARLQVPFASRRVELEARERIGQLNEAGLGNRLASAYRIASFRPWVYPWRRVNQATVIIRGLVDFVIRNDHGSLELVNVAHEESQAERELARLGLSKRFATAQGHSEVERGSIIWMGPAVAYEVHEVIDADLVDSLFMNAVRSTGDEAR